nr:MAG TPA: hypothetical protein [Caudoviricetes sp.]
MSTGFPIKICFQHLASLPIEHELRDSFNLNESLVYFILSFL